MRFSVFLLLVFMANWHTYVQVGNYGEVRRERFLARKKSVISVLCTILARATGQSQKKKYQIVRLTIPRLSGSSGLRGSSDTRECADRKGSGGESSRRGQKKLRCVWAYDK